MTSKVSCLSYLLLISPSQKAAGSMTGHSGGQHLLQPPLGSCLVLPGIWGESSDLGEDEKIMEGELPPLNNKGGK